MKPKNRATRHERRAAAFCLLITAALAVLIVVETHPSAPSGPTSTSTWKPSVSVRVARSMLQSAPTGTLERGIAYDRTADFGPAWADVDHNGCDTRNDVLHRDLVDVATRPGTHECVVVAGRIIEPYTGHPVTFSKSRADEIQIDHLVPLHAAWMLGAFRWTPEQRLAYANDPLVLVAASGPANLDKGDRLANEWKPSNRGSWCPYATATIVVHAQYRLPVTAGERSALTRMLATCPN